MMVVDVWQRQRKESESLPYGGTTPESLKIQEIVFCFAVVLAIGPPAISTVPYCRHFSFAHNQAPY
jgi:hypothetical protein